jgi:putative nucleotidyltransferase with HDIG domain
MHRATPQTAVVIATAYSDLVAPDPSDAPIADFLVKPFERERFALAVDRGRQWHKQVVDEMKWHAQLSYELRDIADGVCGEVDRLAASGKSEADVLAAMAWARTPATMAHGDRVARHAGLIAAELGYDAVLSSSLGTAARFHDIGKLAMPEALLRKPSALTTGEQAIMRRHVDIGAEILASTRSMHELADIVLATHESYNGGGYPLQRAGAAIPLGARIIAVADAYDAMTENREYRSRMDGTEAVAELLRCTGTQFDPDVVGAFLGVMSRQ